MINILRLILAFLTLVSVDTLVKADSSDEALRLYDVSKGKETNLPGILPDLQQKKIILVGEHHTTESHHRAQLAIIQYLHEARMPVAVGLEMFQSDNQSVLDQWYLGNLGQEDFQKAYYDNWGYPWHLYGPIFEYARLEKIPLIALNIPREVTQKVARGGFNSLSKEEKGMLPIVGCNVGTEYMAFIKRAYGAHAHGQINFDNFCEAQLVWDKVMAIHAQRYLESNPDRVMIILAGTGHAWKKGIPEQIRQHSSLPYAVILPEVPDAIEKSTISPEDADYLVLGVTPREQLPSR
jgi:uncharacterized iron-regulated protein